MNFLELVNSLRIEAGASGRAIDTLEAPGLAAETDRFKRWIASAWNDIQIQHTDWNFHLVESTHTLEVGVTVLNMTEFMAGDVAEWMVNTFRITQPASTRMLSQTMQYIDYYYWRNGEGMDTTREGMPQSFSIQPQTEAIHLSMTPDKAYDIFYDYRRTPQRLTEDLDVPIIPIRYHELIVAWAMRKYGYHEVASEKLAQSMEIIGRLFPALEMDQLPEITLATL